MNNAVDGHQDKSWGIKQGCKRYNVCSSPMWILPNFGPTHRNLLSHTFRPCAQCRMKGLCGGQWYRYVPQKNGKLKYCSWLNLSELHCTLKQSSSVLSLLRNNPIVPDSMDLSTAILSDPARRPHPPTWPLLANISRTPNAFSGYQEKVHTATRFPTFHGVITPRTARNEDKV